MSKLCDKRLKRLRQIIEDMGSVLVAFSGGVDSTFLLKVARETIGDKVLAVTARSETYPKREYTQAKIIARELRVKLLTINTKELIDPHFASNPSDRCYYCKKELFKRLKKIALDKGINYIADGTNQDDLDDFRPGMKAVEEMGVKSPLKEAGLTKKEIRILSRRMKLQTWDKPPFACLASRFPCGDKITRKKLQMVGEAEDYLYTLEIKQIRVRDHSGIARIEVSQPEITRLAKTDVRKKIVKKLKEIGYRYVALDLQGYRTGSMNP